MDRISTKALGIVANLTACIVGLLCLISEL